MWSENQWLHSNTYAGPRRDKDGIADRFCDKKLHEAWNVAGERDTLGSLGPEIKRPRVPQPAHGSVDGTNLILARQSISSGLSPGLDTLDESFVVVALTHELCAFQKTSVHVNREDVNDFASKQAIVSWGRQALIPIERSITRKLLARTHLNCPFARVEACVIPNPVPDTSGFCNSVDPTPS